MGFFYFIKMQAQIIKLLSNLLIKASIQSYNMKHYLRAIAFLMVIIISVSFEVSAQYVVKVRPAPPVVVVVPPHRPGSVAYMG